MHGHTHGVSRDRPDFVRSGAERCWIDGDLIRLSHWPVGGTRPGVRGKPMPWLMDLRVLEDAMREVYGRDFDLGDRAPLLQLAADALADGDRTRAAEIADAVAFPAPEFKSRFHDAGLRHLAWGPAHRGGNPRIDIAAWLERKYDPNQPRVPRGHSDGGQWTGGGDGGPELGFDPDAPVDDDTWRRTEELRALAAELRAENGDPSALLHFAAGGRKPSQLVEFYARTVEWVAEHAPFLKRLGAWGKFLWALYEIVPDVAAAFDEPRELEDLLADHEDRVFKTPRAFKDAYGSAGLGREWHHIVEESADPDNVKGYNVNGTRNMVRIPRIIHWAISGHYSEKSDVPGLTIRELLRTLPLERQREYGLWALRYFGAMR